MIYEKLSIAKSANVLWRRIFYKKEKHMIKRGDYQGKPVISLMRKEDDKFPFTFGLAKAKLILENIEEIKAFVAEAEQAK